MVSRTLVHDERANDEGLAVLFVIMRGIGHRRAQKLLEETSRLLVGALKNVHGICRSQPADHLADEVCFLWSDADGVEIGFHRKIGSKEELFGGRGFRWRGTWSRRSGHRSSLRLGIGHLSAVSFELRGPGEFTEFVTDHLLRDVDRREFLAIVNSEGESHELRRNIAVSRPGLGDLLLAFLDHLHDFRHELDVDVGAFFDGTRHGTK
ncbi:MAG: hypothetical protein Greene101449_891 [Candidatus Peregrinibacteria bacterium Greene1014_49]|nr:MAG: hypothetical protein Greene101449_891 [Candidatus Peregrinibacteria bacterium Greene1014_49]